MYYFIVNQTSRSGKAAKIWETLQAYLQQNNIEFRYWILEYEGHATELTSLICKNYEGEIKLVVVGGDGTVNEVINGITDFDRVSFAVIPTGSGNDFIRGLKLKGKPIDHLKRIVASSNSSPIDIGEVSWLDENGDGGRRFFGISAGVGMDAIVCKKALTSKIKKVLNKIGLGKLTYLIITVQTLFSMKTVDAKVQFTGAGAEGAPPASALAPSGAPVPGAAAPAPHSLSRTYEKLIFAAAMNFRAEGGGVPMAPKADATDGLLSICSASGIPKWRTFFVLPVLVMAKHESLKGVEIIDTQEVSMKLNRAEVLHADGEYLADVTEVTFKCIPARLNIMI